MGITAYEKETIILYNEAEDMADIYTHETALKHHIEKELGIKPYFKEGAAREYKVPKSWLRYPRKFSQKRSESSKKSLEARGGFIKRKTTGADVA